MIPNVSRVRTAVKLTALVSTRHCTTCSVCFSGTFSDFDGNIRHCISCQCSKRLPVKRRGLLQPLHILCGPWDHVSADVVTGFP